MSGIYFSGWSDDEEVRIQGAERGMGGNRSDRLAHSILCVDEQGVPDWLIRLLDEKEKSKAIYGDPARGVPFKFAGFGAAEAQFVFPDGVRQSVWETFLNTTFVAAGDVFAFMARLHAQCEVHCFIDGKNRAWLADLVEKGLRDKIMRPGLQWEKLIALARKRADEPLVTSYSVCDSFPNMAAAGRLEDVGTDYAWAREAVDTDFEEAPDDADYASCDGCKHPRHWKGMCDTADDFGGCACPGEGEPKDLDDPHEKWRALTGEAQWRFGIAGLRTQKLLEVTPENLHAPIFGAGRTCFDLWAVRQNQIYEENRRQDEEFNRRRAQEAEQKP